MGVELLNLFSFRQSKTWRSALVVRVHGSSLILVIEVQTRKHLESFHTSLLQDLLTYRFADKPIKKLAPLSRAGFWLLLASGPRRHHNDRYSGEDQAILPVVWLDCSDPPSRPYTSLAQSCHQFVGLGLGDRNQ